MKIKDIIEITSLFIIFIGFFIWLVITIHNLKIADRIGKNTAKSKEDNISVIDKILNFYVNKKKYLINKLIPGNKSSYEKNKKRKQLDKLFTEIIFAFIFIVIYIILSIFYLSKITFLNILLVFILGFLFPNIIYLIKQNQYRKKIEKDLLKAIVLIKNNLDANKSIKEAIINTASKLDGEISYELNEVVRDLNHGLSISNSFKRMQERTKVDDLIYLTTALSILSKTGGNSKDVFNYLENLFEVRNKLNHELNATISSSKLVYIILSILPIVVFGGMVLIYDGYLDLIFNTDIGKLLGMIEFLIYIIYIFIIRKIMIIDKY